MSTEHAARWRAEAEAEPSTQAAAATSPNPPRPQCGKRKTTPFSLWLSFGFQVSASGRVNHRFLHNTIRQVGSHNVRAEVGQTLLLASHAVSNAHHLLWRSRNAIASGRPSAPKPTSKKRKNQAHLGLHHHERNAAILTDRRTVALVARPGNGPGAPGRILPRREPGAWHGPNQKLKLNPMLHGQADGGRASAERGGETGGSHVLSSASICYDWRTFPCII